MSQGIDTTQFDPTIRPHDDLFRHVNGPWLESAEIPPDRATAGAFLELHDVAEAKIRAIVESSQAEAADEEQRKIGDLYASFMDDDRIEELGATPLAPELAKVDAITSISEFVDTLGDLERSGVGSVFGMFIGPDDGNPDRYVTYLMQSGLGLPDESYYREDDFASIRAAYVAHLKEMFDLAGIGDAQDRADRVFALETKIAGFHWDRVTCRDAQKAYNPRTHDQLRQLTTTFDWDSWASHAQLPEPVLADVVVGQPSYFEGLNTLLAAAQNSGQELESWKDWLRSQVIHGAAAYLSSAFVDANFAFYGKTLSGTDELRPRWKRGVGFVEGAMGEALGKIYVRTEFPASSKARMDELIANLIAAYRQSITALSWMSEDTKAQALDKLDSFTPKIGHPDKWRDYSTLETDRADLLGNARRALGFAMDREIAKIGSPIDRDEWYMTPQTVNAYYNASMNEIVFPAAILQPPFFHADADDAVNYGAIGAVIGHEIGHGFDDQGSHYDGTGALRNWWTDEDRESFEKLTGALIAQYNELSPTGADGHTINGELTIGENIGDLGGLGIAYKAFKLSQNGGAESEGDAPKIGGLTADQRFFISWAQAWQGKVRDQEVIRRLATDPHSPPEFRCNQVVRNIDAFYDAFAVSKDDALWLDPEERVTIW